MILLITAAVAVAAIPAYSLLRNAGQPDPVTLDAGEAVADRPPPSGQWSLVADGGFVGYRITEPLDVTVVGRTEEVDGTMEVAVDGDGSTVELAALEVRADLGALRSDAAARDQALRGRILETDEFPDAAFTAEAPVRLEDVRPGAVQSIRVPGTLVIRDRRVGTEAHVDVRWSGEVVRVVGRVNILLSDFAVESPAGAIDDQAVVELDLTFAPTAG